MKNPEARKEEKKMLNQVVLVGRLTKDVEIEKRGEKDFAVLNLAVQRSFKSPEGEYDTDFINCVLWNEIAQRTSDYCKKGDIVGIKGRLQVASYEDEDGNKKYKAEVVAERVTFLSSKKNDE